MNGIDVYKDTSVTTQSKGNLVVMLYDGAIKFMKMAIQEIESNNHEAKGQYIKKAQDIIVELNTVLDMEAGGEIALNLRKLYLYMGRRLNEANTKQDPKRISEVITLMEELNQGWKAIAK